jgi:cardiolipin synthase
MLAEINEELYSNGDEWLAAVSQVILSAQKFIYFESYIFNNDNCGKQIIDLLKTAAARGVRVSIIVDGIGSPHWSLAMIAELKKANIESRVYHPTPFLLTEAWFIHYFKITSFLKILSKLNKRNHRKLIIIDDCIAIIGSVNIADCHLKSVSAEKAWRDTAIKIESPEVKELKKVFENTWEKSWHKGKIWRPRLPKPIQYFEYFLIYGSIRSRMHHYHQLLNRLKNAKRKVYITNAYFVPRTRLLMALKNCAKRGVDVRVMVPSHSDVFIEKWATISFYEGMIKSGIRIFEYGPNMLHAKTIIIDDWAIVGSCNLNNRSFMHDLEINAVLQSEVTKKQLLDLFEKDIFHCHEIQKLNLKSRSMFSKLLSRFAISIKYWL